MSFALKENSETQRRSHKENSVHNGKSFSTHVSPHGAPRQALSAKPINIEGSSHRTTGSPTNGIGIKRASTSGSLHGEESESKRTKLLDTIASDRDTDDDLTDDDVDNGVDHNETVRAPTPHTELHARRSLSRRSVLYPRSNLSDLSTLEVDTPSTNKLCPIADDYDDILEGIKLEPLRMKPPRFIPGFLEEFEKNMKVSLDDLPDLRISDDELEDCSISTLDLNAPVGSR